MVQVFGQELGKVVANQLVPYFNGVLKDRDAADVALYWCWDVCAAATVVCFVVGEISGNVSQVDKLWSIMPVVYALIFNYFVNTPRQRLMTFVVFVWGLRLTLNFMRRGGYRFPKIWEGEEDYRWVYVRKMLKADKYPVLWSLFDLIFVCTFFHVILLGQAMPAYVAARNLEKIPAELQLEDFFIALGVLFFIFVEFVADEQHQRFQKTKRELIKKHGKNKIPAPYAEGFFQQKLWSVCRHPNYAAEQAIWIVFYLWVPMMRNWNWRLHWSAFGWIFLVMLFTPSAMFSESLCVEKYPKYRIYQQKTFMFLPMGTIGSTDTVSQSITYVSTGSL